MTQVTVDGVMQGNGGPSDEDRKNGFDRGGWAMGAGDDETMARAAYDRGIELAGNTAETAYLTRRRDELG